MLVFYIDAPSDSFYSLLAAYFKQYVVTICWNIGIYVSNSFFPIQAYAAPSLNGIRNFVLVSKQASRDTFLRY